GSRTPAPPETHRSGGVALGGAGAPLRRLDLTVLGRRGGLQVGEQVHRRVRDRIDRAVERLLVGLRRLVEAADLADVLERGGLDLFGRGGGLEVVERADVAAHALSST